MKIYYMLNPNTNFTGDTFEFTVRDTGKLPSNNLHNKLFTIHLKSCLKCIEQLYLFL